MLYLQPSGVSAWRHAGPGPAFATRAAFETFGSWAAAHPGADAQVFLSGHLIHSLAIEPALQVRGEAAVRGYARHQFTHYHGATSMQWPMAVWSGSSGVGACAAHAVDVEALVAAAQAHGIGLLGICPAWSAGLTSLSTTMPSFAGAGRHALLLAEGGLVTWLVADGGAVVTLQQRYLDTPCVAALGALCDDLVACGKPLVAPPQVIGWGLDDEAVAAADAPAAVAKLLGPTAQTHWMLDIVGSPA